MSLWWQGRWIDRATHPDGEVAWAACAAQNAVGQAKSQTRVPKKPPPASPAHDCWEVVQSKFNR